MEFSYLDNKYNTSQFLTLLQESDRVGLDIETSSLDPFTCIWLLLQIEINESIFVLDVRKLGIDFITYVIQLIKESNKLVVGHNLKFDTKIIYHYTKEILTNLFDIMLAETLIYNGLGKNFYASLETLCRNYLEIELNKEIRKTFFDYTGEITNEQIVYSGEDVKYLIKIMDIQLKTLTEQSQINVANLEMSLIPVFMHMEYTGIFLDKEEWLKNKENASKLLEITGEKLLDYVVNSIDFTKFENALAIVEQFRVIGKSKLTKKLQEALKNLRGEFISGWFRDNFNLNSPIQLLLVLNYIGIPIKDTNEKTLQKFKNHEIIKIILEYREYSKQISTYGEEFLNHIHPVTGMVHTQYNQLGAVSGRLSSEHPNLQNQPRLQSYRDCYKARPGYKILTADYSQAELKALGDFTKEPEFINAFNNKVDMHRKTASFLYEIPVEEINSEQRHDGKTMNFATVYGTTAWGLYYNFGIPLETAEDWLDKYFKGYKVLKYVQDKVGDLVWENKFSSTLYGRKRYFEDKRLFTDANERDKYIAKTKREGFNHIIQGGIGDTIKISMRDIFYSNEFDLDDLRILLQTHDELCVEIKDEIIEKGAEFVKEKMLNAQKLFLKDISPGVDIFIADCWRKE